MAHFLEADEQPWAAALAAALFAPFVEVTPAEDQEPPKEGLDSSTAAIAVDPEPPQPSHPVLRAVRKASSSGARLLRFLASATRRASSRDAAHQQTWRHLDELAPLGDAADAVLRAWRLPLCEQLRLTPAKWQPAVISSHVADGWLTLDCAEVVACSNAMRGVRGVHSLALNLKPDRPAEGSKAACQGAHRAIAALPTLRALTLELPRGADDSDGIAPLLSRLPQLVHLQLSISRRVATLAAALGRLTAMTRLELIHIFIWEDDAPALFPVLGLMPRLAHLSVRHTNMDASGAAELAVPLSRLTALTFLNISHNYFKTTGLRALAPTLGNLPRLAHLDLSGNSNHAGHFGGCAHCAVALATSLSHLTALTLLDLGMSGTGAAESAALVPVLSRLTRLVHLGLSTNSIDDDTAAALAQPLALLTALTALDLGDNSIGPSGADALAPALACLSRMVDLCLPDTMACGRVVASLAALTALTRLPVSYNMTYGREFALTLNHLLRLATLDLCDWPWNRSDIESRIIRDAGLVPALSHLTALTRMNLRFNRICAAGAAALAPALSRLTALVTLDLSYNYVGAAGAASLVPALSRLTALVTLDLSCNQFGAAGASALAPSLSRLTALETLDMNRNNFGAAGAAALAPALSCLTALSCVHLYENGIGDVGASSLAPALRRLCRLSHLSLGRNEIGAAGIAALAPALSLLSELSCLSLCANPVGDEGVAHLVPALARLPCLGGLYLGQPHGVSDRGRAALVRGLPRSVRVSSSVWTTRLTVGRAW